MFNIYRASIRKGYRGICFIAANSPEEAMKYISDFQESDPDNDYDSYGIMPKITEEDIIPDMKGTVGGVLFNSVYYSG